MRKQYYLLFMLCADIYNTGIELQNDVLLLWVVCNPYPANWQLIYSLAVHKLEIVLRTCYTIYTDTLHLYNTYVQQ